MRMTKVADESLKTKQTFSTSVSSALACNRQLALTITLYPRSYGGVQISSCATCEIQIDLDHLRQLCEHIQLSSKPSISLPIPKKPIHYVLLEFPSILTFKQRLYKMGRFVGRYGKHIRLIQKTLNVTIRIVNHKTHRDLHQIVAQFKKQNEESSKDGLCLLITMKNDNDNIEKIKQSLRNEWGKVDVTTYKKKRSVSGRQEKRSMFIQPDISGDSRWKPKRQKPRDKYKGNQKQYDEQEEIQPQPLVRPISLPKPITTHQKNRQK